MCVRASVVLMQCTIAHHIKFVRASYVKFHTLLNNNKGQIRLNLISHVFTLNMNFPGYQFLVAKSVLNGRNGTVFAVLHIGCANVNVRASSLAPVYIGTGNSSGETVLAQWVINYHQHNYHQQKMAAASSGREQQSAISLFPGLPDS